MENGTPPDQPSKAAEAAELEQMVVASMNSAHGLLETCIPLVQAQIRTVVVGLHKSGTTMITANMNVDTLIYALATAHAQALRIKEAQGPKIVLASGEVDIKKLKRLREN